MNYVFGITKRFNNPKSEKNTKRSRKYYFCYKFDLESGKFRRIRISSVKAFYYKITFIFGLKSRKITNVKCKDCKKKYDCIVNFWEKDLNCPYC